MKAVICPTCRESRLVSPQTFSGISKGRQTARCYPCAQAANAERSQLVAQERLLERFWSKVEKAEGCWPWRGTQKGDGYGTFKIGQQKIGAHRFMWTVAHGAIPDGLHVLHRCDNPPCVRPDHLFLGTHADNMRDMALKGRGTGRPRKQAAA